MMLLVYFAITLISLCNCMVMATESEECTKYRFPSPFYPGYSCEDIYNKNPESHTRSGYYWILDGPSKVFCGMNFTGSSCEDIYRNNPKASDKSGYYRINNTQWAYCNMTAITIAVGILIPTCAGVGGGWKKIVNIDISAGDDCPSGWRNDTNSGINFCRMVSDLHCDSVYFSTNGTSYQRVCGRARGYQKGNADGFYGYHNGHTIDGPYAECLSITYGSPRRHIWTYAVGNRDSERNPYNCPCAVGGGLSSPPFVGTNYYCESGAADTAPSEAYFVNDPLWDGSGCITSNCCDNAMQPWFYRELNESTSSDIEARLCSWDVFFYEAVLIDQLELYVQ